MTLTKRPLKKLSGNWHSKHILIRSVSVNCNSIPDAYCISCLLFFKGGDPIEFKKINDAYNKLIGHAAKIDAIEAEAELSRTSVIIEVSKQAVPKWKTKLQAAYGLPKTSKVNNLLFNVSLYFYLMKDQYLKKHLLGPLLPVLWEGQTYGSHCAGPLRRPRRQNPQDFVPL